ncbi:U3 small nucleolar RNA-associated protein 6 -like protein [Trichinella nativa]|uniref:U3 small nucleolar RNA-associated protein 6-like protein n=1 Tax=Trichinella nativa TaxID=6335 RepID=A0A0V1LT27_9BILA|nr:U3 small nucleolar RNA-associated protein 6 -like protein [Trichinella nativa]
MSEFVQLHLEEFLPVFEHLEHLRIFNKNEIRMVIKKLKYYEYKQQKRNKTKEDLLNLIKYLCSFYLLIRERRSAIKVFSNKEEIEFILAGRIDNLYRVACRRHPDDENIWLARIQFAEKRKMFHSVSKLYLHMLQLHTRKPNLWLLAAKWEFEKNGSCENARLLLQRAIRFNEKSNKIWIEYFRFELLYIEKLYQRYFLIRSSENGEKDIEEEFNFNRYLKLPEIVFLNAAKAIPNDLKLFQQFLNIAGMFPFSEELKETIMKFLEANFDDEEFTDWHIRRKYEQSLGLDGLIIENDSAHVIFNNCIQLYEEEIQKKRNEKIWKLYINFCRDIFHSTPSGERLKVESYKRMFIGYAICCRLFPENFNFILEWACVCPNLKCKIDVLKFAISKHPQKVEFWLLLFRIMDKMKLSKEETIALLKRAVNSVAEKDAFPIWKTVINWYSCNVPSKLEEQLESALLSTSIVSNYAKLVYLKNASQSVEVDALGNIRKLFNRLRLIAPNELKFYRFYINIELSQNVKSTKHIRSAYEFALLEHGKDCLKIWLEYMQFESDCTEGDPCRCSRIYSQALKNLRPDLVKQFVETYTLLIANGAMNAKLLKLVPLVRFICHRFICPLVVNSSISSASSAYYYSSFALTPNFGTFTLATIDRTSMMLILLTFLASAFIFICFAISLHFIIKYVSSIEQRWRMIWLLQIFLAISVCSCVGMCVPRAIAVCEIMMLFSFSQCLFKYVRFIVGCFDGEENMTFRLEGDYINYREPELCCICCPCLPVKVITKDRIRAIRWLIYQNAVLLPISYILALLVKLDKFDEISVSYPIIITVTTVSALVAAYGTILLSKISLLLLKDYCLTALKVNIQLLIFFFNFQMPLFRLLTVGTITCNGIIPAYDRSFMWSQVLLVTECLVLSYVLCWFLRPCVNKAFDLYPVHLPKRLPVYVDVTTSIDDGIMLELSKKSNQSKVPHNAL